MYPINTTGMRWYFICLVFLIPCVIINANDTIRVSAERVSRVEKHAVSDGSREADDLDSDSSYSSDVSSSSLSSSSSSSSSSESQSDSSEWTNSMESKEYISVEDDGRRSLKKTVPGHELLLDESFFNKYEYYKNQIEPPSITDLEPTVTKDTFRRLYITQMVHDKMIHAIGYVLRVPQDALQIADRSPLRILHNTLKINGHRLADILPLLKSLNGNNKTQEVLTLFNDLKQSKGLCSLECLMERVTDGSISIDKLFGDSSEFANGIIINGLTRDDIEIAANWNADELMLGYNGDSLNTNYLLGPMYVKIFKILHQMKPKLSQALAGSIIRDLQNIYNCPIMAEYKKYLTEWAFKGEIPDWSQYNDKFDYKNVFAFINSFVFPLMSSKNIPLETKKALLFTKNQFFNAYHKDSGFMVEARDVDSERGFNLKLLFELEVYTQTDSSLKLLKLYLRQYLTANINGVVYDTLKTFDRYAYITTDELCLAILARLQLRLPQRDVKVKMVVSALIAHLMMLRRFREITHPKLHLSTVFFIIDAIYEPHMSMETVQLIRSLENQLLEFFPSKDRDKAKDSFDKNLMPSRLHCLRPKQCALLFLKRFLIPLKKLNVPLSMLAKIRQLIDYLQMNVEPDDTKNTWNITATKRPEKSQRPPTPMKPPSVKKPSKNDEPIKSSTAQGNDNHNANFNKITVTGSGVRGARSSLLPPISTILRNVSTLPPTIRPEACIIIDPNYDELNSFPTVSSNSNPDNSSIILPSMVELQEQSDKNYILEHVNPQCSGWIKHNIIKPLIVTYGENFMIQLLGNDWSTKYPTRISALMSLLIAVGTAKQDGQKVLPSDVLLTIKKTIQILQLISPYLFLPMISQWKLFDREIIWTTINIHHRTWIVINSIPSIEKTNETVTLPIVNPLYWCQRPENQDDPFPSLLPNLPSNSSYVNKLQPLVSIFELSKLTSLIDKQIDVSKFPNKGALLVWTLHQLNQSEKIKKNTELLKLIRMYLQAIQRLAIYTKIPSEVVIQNVSKNTGFWSVDFTKIMNALPRPHSNLEKKMWKSMEKFFSKLYLLDKLGIALPSRQFKIGEFLALIIETALVTKKIPIDESTRQSLNYYKDKILHTGAGGENVAWIWIRKIVIETEMNIGKIIETVLAYDKLPRDDQKAYNCLIAFLTRHPEITNVEQHFPIEKYKTMGEFLRGFLQYLIDLPKVERDVKVCMKKLLPHVKVTGTGQRGMPKLKRMLSRRNYNQNDNINGNRRFLRPRPRTRIAFTAECS